MSENSKFSGFTLVEVFVVLALFVALSILLLEIFLANNRFYQSETAEVAVNHALREAADRINEFTRLATSFEISYIYNAVTYNTGSTTAIFKIPAIDATDNTVTGAYDYAIIAASSTLPSRLDLFFVPDALSARIQRTSLLTDKVTVVNFTYDNPDPMLAKIIYYSITVTEPALFPVSDQIQGAATLRN